jgi:hypothetical protein
MADRLGAIARAGGELQRRDFAAGAVTRNATMKTWKVALSLGVVAAVAAPLLVGTWRLWTRIINDPMNMLTLGLLIVGGGQALLFLWQLRLIRAGLADTKEAADGAKKPPTSRPNFCRSLGEPLSGNCALTSASKRPVLSRTTKGIPLKWRLSLLTPVRLQPFTSDITCPRVSKSVTYLLISNRAKEVEGRLPSLPEKRFFLRDQSQSGALVEPEQSAPKE